MLRERTKIAMIMAEFLGTAILTVTALAILTTMGNTYFIALGMGLALAALVVTLGHVSGAHLNPAITVGLLTARQIKLPLAIVYIAAQLLGGFVAYALYMYLTDRSISPAGSYDSRLLVSEAVGGFVFAMGWAAALYNRYEAAKTAFTVGGALAVGILAASLVSGGIVNPAVALGLHSWVWGTYALGPVIGAVIGFNLYALLFAPAKELVKAEEKGTTKRS